MSYNKHFSLKQIGLFKFTTGILIILSLLVKVSLTTKLTFQKDDQYQKNNQPKIEDNVTLMKVCNLKLNNDDLLYESIRNKNFNNFHLNNDPVCSVTGNFPDTSTQIWDPYPEYILNAFGHKLHLVLHQDASFISSDTFGVTKILNNTEEKSLSGGSYLGCYYTGHVKGDLQSAVAVSLCDGMTGLIKTKYGSFLIQPISETTNNESLHDSISTSKILHKIWRYSRHKNTTNSVPPIDNIDFPGGKQHSVPKLNRSKRALQHNPLTIEVFIAVDPSMEKFHKTKLTSYVLTLISIASKLFIDPSLGISINILVTNIFVLKLNKSKSNRISSSAVLQKFCNRMQKSRYHYDAAIFLTRDICGQYCQTLGIANSGAICKSNACLVVQDIGLPAAFTIAHELGHILNMPHEDEDRCKRFQKADEKEHIMSRTAGDIDHWSWSDCSRHFLFEHLEREDVSCLQNTGTKHVPNRSTSLPGKVYSLDEQCQLSYGPQSRYCKKESECTELWCYGANDSNCNSHNAPWANGTPCNVTNGNKTNYWCQMGECLPIEGHKRQVIDGGWGNWSDWSQCSLTCGGGLQMQTRDCNNPIPKNRGKYCTGSGKNYRSCNTNNCPPGSMDIREQQCYRYNGKAIKGFGRDTKWIPKYGVPPKDQCTLDCRAEGLADHFRLSEKVVDGTRCSLDSFDKCVNGVCRSAGCDNELNSIAKLDKCGVCEGHNDTCEEVTGNFYVSDLFKVQPKSFFYPVTIIPKGSSNIVIEQIGYPIAHHIVLKDDEGNYLLNGKFLQGYPTKNVYAGLVYEYNGSRSSRERVTTTYGRKLKKNLYVEIISFPDDSRSNNTLLLTYKYTKDKPIVRQ